MAVDYSKVTHADVKSFLSAAATDHDVREKLVNATPASLRTLLKSYNIQFKGSEKIPDPPRMIPTRAECEQLIELFGLGDEFADAMYSRSSSALAPLIMVIGHAMPLVATVESEVAAAG